MKRFVLPVLLLLWSQLSIQAQEAASAADEGKSLTSRISAVTVYVDRARVTRTASVELEADATTFAFRKLPGWIDEGSVRVSLTPPEAGQLLDVEIERTYLARNGDEEVRKAEAAVQEIADQVAALEDEKAVLAAQERQLDAVRAFSLDKLPRDMAVRDIKVASYAEVVDYLAASMRKIAQTRRELEQKRRALAPELSVRQRQLDDLRQRSQLEERTVLVSVKGSSQKKATLTLTYMLPGATWEPAHELRAGKDSQKVSLASFAVVTQTTGEDWSGAELALSTQRPTATMRLPELEALFVGQGRPIARVSASNIDTFQSSQQAYAAQNQLWDRARRGVRFEKEYQENIETQRVTQARAERVFAELQERGTTAHFQALGKQSVRADGRLVRVPIGTVELAAKHRILAAPEVSLNAAHTVDLSNTGAQPLLPGRVALYLEGAFLGQTEIDFVAQGESFALFLGVEDRVKLTRALDSKHSSMVRDGKRTRMQVAYVEGVENLSDREVVVQLTERVPVSESDDVKVRNIKITPEGRPDDKGLLRQELTLPPKQKREFRVEYTLEYPTGLPQLAPAPRRATEFDEEGLEAPAPAPAQDLYRQIDQLEKALK